MKSSARGRGNSDLIMKGSYSASQENRFRYCLTESLREARTSVEMPPTILIAEDYDDNRELLRLLLAGANYNVREARNGQECVDLACENPPDLIMVDLSMPELDGWEVFRVLKANASTAHIPCVAITAHTDRDRARALQSGFSDFVGKPFRTEDLLMTVARLVAK
jgi:two-component system, cell cycle response regulator DivK